MDRQKFIDKLQITPDISKTAWAENVMIAARESADNINPDRPAGYHHLDICKEECAELIQELSKETRGKGDYYNILQELADVIICTKYVQMQFDIDEETLGKAISVKLKRIENKLKEGAYQ